MADRPAVRPALLKMPATILHRLTGAFADELLLGGQRVLPDKAQASGFLFRHETVRSAFDAMLGHALSPGRAPQPRLSPPQRDTARSAPSEQPVDQPSVDTAARLLRSLRAR